MRSSASPLYEPLNEYKHFGPHIGLVDGPLEYLTMAGFRLPLPFTTRMTVVQLANGDLFLHSPIAFNPELARQLSSGGRVRHLVSPNQFHYAHVGEWSRAFPDAITWASPHARERARARGIEVQFKRDLGEQVPDDWRSEIDRRPFQAEFSGNSSFSTGSPERSYSQTPLLTSSSKSSRSPGALLRL